MFEKIKAFFASKTVKIVAWVGRLLLIPAKACL